VKIAILGAGGREHALAWKLTHCLEVEQVYVMPGNPGIPQTCSAKLVAIDLDDFSLVASKCQEYQIDFALIGPEAPLAKGLSDALCQKGVVVLAPSQAAARLESSKSFAKQFMVEQSIPTASYQSFNSYQAALTALTDWELSKGVVIKADGLAAGKGVVITDNLDVAKQTLYDFMENPDYPIHDQQVVIEQKVTGQEASVFLLSDGNNYQLLGHACDYKRLKDGDQGPNTGGMGCYHDPKWPTADHYQTIEQRIIHPTLEGMKKRGIPFKGILFLGLMIDGDQINLLEYNVRFGDPETQTLLPLLDNTLAVKMLQAANNQLPSTKSDPIKKNSDHSCSLHVVLASGGYPAMNGESMVLDQPIKWQRPSDQGSEIFFAGVGLNEAGTLINSGGRVAGITTVAPTLQEARSTAYQQIKQLNFQGAQFRSDIGRDR
jgi:phosphoribosylamine--glycine ligase